MNLLPLPYFARLFFCALLLIVSVFGAEASAQSLLNRIAGDQQRVDHVQVRLLTSHEVVSPGGVVLAGLQIDHDPLWHTYWRNPGDSGLATSLSWSLDPVGGGALSLQGETQWPAPRRIPVGPLANYGYEGTMVLGQRLVLPSDLPVGQTIRLRLEARWLVCKDVCIPGEAVLERSLKVAQVMSAPGPDEPALSRMLASLPVSSGAGQGYMIDEPGQRLWVWGKDPLPKGGSLFPELEALVNPAAAQARYEGQGLWMLELVLAESRSEAVGRLKQTRLLNGVYRPLAGPEADTGLRLTFASADQRPMGLERVDAGLTAQQEYDRLHTTGSGGVQASSVGLLTALLFAFVGGLILNLMPCVFPVLGLKVLSFGAHAHAPSQARQHALLFAVGAVLSMLALAGLLLVLRAAGEAIGWGFQLQNPWVIAILALLFVAIATNLLGAFEFGTSLTRLGALDRGEGPWGALGSGALAVVVASPCTAPFMGSAIGFTATAGALETLLVFAVLALGLAAPVSVLMLWPAALRWIPKPGEWMVRFRQLLAFPMLATAAWLAWVLAELDGLTALLQVLMAMVLLALSLWAVGAGGRWRVVTPIGFVAIALLFVLRPLQVSMASDDSAPVSRVTAAADEVQWQPWAPGLPQSLAAAGQVVFVDFTAAWCISCQANKARVLRTDPVAGALAQADVVALVADWTRQDPAITQALREQGRNGVPMYLVYPKGGGAPHMLSEWLSSDEVMAALKKAGMGTSKP
ncbi:MAG: protein-disulfide reductase DsbD family protein [Burkholderiaceae bacterium]